MEEGFNRLPVATTLTLGSGVNSGKLIVARDQTVAGLATSGSGTANAVVGGSSDLSTFTVNLAADATYTGLFGGAGLNENNLALAKSGAGNLTLTSAHTATGTTTVNAGTLTLSGANGSLSANGVTILTGGTVVLDNSVNNHTNRVPDSSAITLVGGVGATTLRVQNDGVTAGTYSETFGPLIVVGSSGTVTINNIQAETGSATSSSTLTFASLIKSSGVTLDFVGEGLGDSNENRIFFTGLADGPIPGATVTSVADGTDDAQYITGQGVVRLLNYDTTYTINSHPGGGSLAATPAGWTGSTVKANPAGGVRLTGGGGTVTINQLKLDNDGSLNTPGYNAIDLNGGTLVLTTGALRSNGVANQSVIDSFGGGKLTAGTGLAPGVLTVTAGVANQITISAEIGNNGAQPVSLVKLGDGTAILSAANTFTGKTAVNAGVLSIAADSGLGVAPGAPLADSLTLNGGTVLLGNGVSLAANRGITLGSSHGTVQVAGSDSATINGIITGALRNLTKTGTGTLTLNRANTFTGVMTLNGGTLVATASTGALGAGTVILTSGNLLLQDDTARAFARNTTINGDITVTTDRLNTGAGLTHSLGTLSIGAQVLTVNAGANMVSGTAGFSFTGAVTATGAPTFTVNNNGSLATTLLTLGSTVASGANLLTFNGTGNATVTGVITGSGGLTASGSGVLTLTANNGATLSGPITIGGGGGTVLLGNGGALGSGATAINGGTLASSGSGALTVANNLTFGGDVILGQAAGGTGALTLGGTVDLGGVTRTITVNNAADTIGGVISNTAGGLTKAGTGTLTLTGANTFTGSLTVNRGTLVADTATNATILDSSLPLSMGGATFQLKGFAATARSQTLNGLTLTAGANVVDANNLGTSTTLDLSGTGGTAVITRSAGSTVDFKATTGGPLNATTAMIKSAQLNDANGIVGAWATVDGGANLARNDGSNFIVAYNGYVDIAARGPGSTIADATASNVRINTAGTSGAIDLGAATSNINTLMQNTATASTVDTAGKILRLGTTGSILLTPTAAAAGTLTIGSAVNDGTLTAGGNADGVAGELILNNNATTAALTINAVVANNTTGVVTLVKSGAAPVILAGTNTYTGGTTINAGTLTIGGAGTLGSGSYAGAITIASGATFTYSSSAAQTLSGVISGNGIFTKAGTGTLTLSGANTFTSNLTLTGGALVADTVTNPTVLNPSATLILGGATFELRGLAATVRSQTLNGLTLNANTNNVVDVNNLGTSTTLDLRGATGLLGITRGAGSTVDFKASSGALNSTTAVIKLAQPNVNGILGPWATANGGTDLAANDGSNNIVAYTGYADVTRLDSGTKVITSATASNVRIIEGTGSASEITPAAIGTTDINTLLQSVEGGTGAAVYNPGTTDVLRLGAAGGIIMAANSGTLTIGTAAGDGILTAGGAPNTAGDIMLNNQSSAALTINSTVTNNGSGVVTLTKSGSGPAILTDANTYTGATTITGGSLQIGDGGTTGSLSISSALVNNSTLIFNRSNTLTQGTDFNAVISGTGVVTKTGSGTLNLSGTNTFTGDVNLSGGTLVVGMGTGLTGNLGSSVAPATFSKTVYITNNAIFRNTTTWNDGTGSGTVQQVVINIGSGGGTIDTAPLTTLTLDDGSTAGNANNAAQLQGSGNLTKIGNGTLSLGNGTSNFGTFTGEIFVNNGTLTTGAVSTNPFGDTLAGTTVASGAVLDVKGVNIGAEPLTISGTGISSGGALISSSGSGGTATGSITLAANSSVGGATALTLSGNITGGFAITKVGAGNLTLSGTTNTFSGGVNLDVGTLTVGSTTALGATAGTFAIAGGTTLNSSVANLVNANNNPVTMNGDFTFTGTQSLDLGTGAVSLGSTAGTRTITTTANVLTLGGIVADGTATALAKSGAGVLVLGGANVYTGSTTINAGLLRLNHATALPGGIAATGGTSALTLAATTGNNPQVGLGASDFLRALGTGVDQVQITGTAGGVGFAAFGADRVVNLGGASAALTWGSGGFVPTGVNFVLGHSTADAAVDFQNPIDLAGAVRTVQVDNGTATVDATLSGLITGAAGSGVTKTGTGTLLLSVANTYSGATDIQNGGVTLGVTDALPTTTALTVGSGTTSATLDLQTFDQTVASLSSTANTAAVSSIVIGTGKTLTVNGNVSLNNNTNNAQTSLTMSGGGALVVSGTSFTVGNNTTGTSNASRATLNLAALSSFTATLSGNLSVQLTGDNQAANASTLILSNTANDITAAAIGVGVSGTGTTQTLTLGAGTNLLKATTFNFGTGARDGASVSFGANPTGTLTLTDTVGGRAVMNIGTGSATTGFVLNNTINFAGHDVDLLLSTFTMGNQFRNGAINNQFTFDTGTFDATTVRVGIIPAAAGTQASVTYTHGLNLNGGDVTIGTGGLEVGTSVAANTSLPKTNNVTINIGGSTVTIANNPALGAAIRLVNNSGAANVNNVSAVLNITSGSLTVAGDIIKGAAVGTGTNTATLNLNGASAVLDLTGNDITGLNSIVYTDGLLKNLGVVNTGMTLAGTGARVFDQGASFFFGQIQGAITGTGLGLTKQGAGYLTLSGANTYDGVTTVTGGMLALNNANALPGGIGVSGGTSALTLSGGIIGLANGNFTRALGTGVDQVQFTGSGGFAAFVADRVVNLGGASAGVSWNTGNFIPGGSALILGAVGADKTVDFQNPIDFNGLDRTVQVDNGTAMVDARLTGLVTSTGGGGLVKTGAGTLALSGLNTYAGNTLVSAGTLSFDTLAAGASPQALGTASAVNLGVAATSSGTLEYTGAAGTFDKNINALGNGSDTIQNSGTGLLTLTGTLDKTGTTLTLKGGSNGITVSGAIVGNTGSPNSDLIIDGGTTTLASANTYNGPTSIINGATLNANVANALPTANGRTAVSVDQTGSGSSILALGASQSIASLSGAATSTVTLGANNLTIGAASGSATFAGTITSTGGGLTKDNASTQVLSGTNSYTGPTNVQAGTLEISGSINASTSVQLDGGTLLLSGLGGEQVKDTATINLNGGTLAFGSQSGVTETLGALTLSSNSVLDFGAGDSNTFNFSNLTITGGTLSIYNWTGTGYGFPPESDHGGNQDRLLFGADVSSQTLSQIAFYDGGMGSNFLGSGAQISFNGGYEIVPVPEPSSTALIGAAGLLALVGYRERRRLSGALGRKSKLS